MVTEWNNSTKNRRTAHVCKIDSVLNHFETTFRLVVLSRDFARNDKIPRVGLDVFPRVALFGNDYIDFMGTFAKFDRDRWRKAGPIHHVSLGTELLAGSSTVPF